MFVFIVHYVSVYSKLNGDQAGLQMLVYVLANVVGVCLGLYKINAMGLLPTHQSDWLEFILLRDVSGTLSKSGFTEGRGEREDLLRGGGRERIY